MKVTFDARVFEGTYLFTFYQKQGSIVLISDSSSVPDNLYPPRTRSKAIEMRAQKISDECHNMIIDKIHSRKRDWSMIPH